MKKLIIILTVLFPAVINAQISGIVRDKQTHEPLAGCTVILQDFNQATLTLADGRFHFQAPPEGKITLEFKYLGYKTVIKTVEYNGQPIHMEILMERSPIRAEEVLVTAFLPSTQHTSALKTESINLGNSLQNPVPNVLQSLTSVPGVEIYSKGVGIGMPVIRGLSKTNIIVLNNGFRLEDYQFSENHPFFIDEFGTSRIEIIKGTASLLYGSDAIGGVINALWENPAPINSTQSDFAVQYHTNTRGWVTSTGIKSSKKNFSFGIRAGYNTNADMRDGAGRQVTNTRFLRQTVKAFATITHKNSSHKLFTEYSRDKLGLCVAPAFSLVTDDKRFPEYFYQNLNHTFIGNKNTWFISKYGKILLNLSYEHNRRGLTVVPDQPKTIDMDLNNLTYDLRLTWQRQRLSAVTGVQGFYVKNKNFGQSVFLPDYQTQNSAIYALSRFSLTQNLNIIGGLRYDLATIAFSSPAYSPGQFPDTTVHFGNFSGSIGGTMKLNPWLMLRTNLATGYRNPNAAELAENGIHAFRYETGNLSLKAQRSYEADFSMHVHKKRFIADIAVYYNDIKNYIFLQPTGDTAANGMKIYHYNQTDAVIYGLETGTEFSYGNLKTKVIYNFTRSRDQDGNSLPFIPQNKLKAFVTYALPGYKNKGKTQLSLNPVYAFACLNPAPLEEPSKSYFLLNLSASTSYKNLTAGISVYNLLNAQYNDHLSSLRDAGFYDMGRNIALSLKVTF